MNQDAIEHWCQKLASIEAVVPSSKANFQRLAELLDKEAPPRIAVFGKYNHGKSTLLNTIIGQEKFKVADKRETTEISEHVYDEVCWIDTPGLDADVKGEDDKRAIEAANKLADILLLVHNVNAGELDRHEMNVYRQLMKQDRNYAKKMLLVLTQVDQCSNDDCIRVTSEIKKQLPDLNTIEVSAVRYQKGISEDKPGFIKASGIPELLELISLFKENVDVFRQKERTRLIMKARAELKTIINDRESALISAKNDCDQFSAKFFDDLSAARDKVIKKRKLLGLY